MSNTFVHASERNLLRLEQSISGIEQEHAQRFSVQRAHFRAEKFIHQLRRIDLFARDFFLAIRSPSLNAAASCTALAEPMPRIFLSSLADVRVRPLSVLYFSKISPPTSTAFFTAHARPQQNRDQFTIRQGRRLRALIASRADDLPPAAREF